MSKIMKPTSTIEKFYNQQKTTDAPLWAYFNLSLVNQNTIAPPLADPSIIYNETLATSIVDNPLEYAFCIERMQLNIGKSLPIWIPGVQNGTNINNTVYGLNIALKNYTIGSNHFTFNSQSSKFMQYAPQDLEANTPNLPITIQDIQTSTYYWVYTFEHVCNLFNITYGLIMTDLYNQFQVQWTANGGTGTAPSLSNQPPYVIYNPASGLFNMYYTAGFLFGNTLTTDVDGEVLKFRYL